MRRKPTRHGFPLDLSISLERQFDDPIGRERVGVDLYALIGIGLRDQVARTILRFKRDFRDLWEASQNALPHFMDKVLDRFANEFMEDGLYQIAHLFGGNVMRMMWISQRSRIGVF